MAIQVTIGTNIVGVSPYDVWVCDKCDSTGICEYIATLTSGELPYTFTLPSVYETYPTFIIKIIDDNGCECCFETCAAKNFEDGMCFNFEDGEIYEFEDE